MARALRPAGTGKVLHWRAFWLDAGGNEPAHSG
jgi:hypothetical protein